MKNDLWESLRDTPVGGAAGWSSRWIGRRQPGPLHGYSGIVGSTAEGGRCLGVLPTEVVGEHGHWWLAVLSRRVVYAGDGWSADGGVVSVMVVGVEPFGKGGGSFLF